jgi:PAS domain S-box-containing protein
MNDRDKDKEQLNQELAEMRQQVAELTPLKVEHERVKASLRDLVELVPDLVAIYSQDVIAFINAAGARLLGASNPGQIVGNPFWDFVPPAYRDSVAEQLLSAREGEKIRLVEQKLVRLDGIQVTVDLTLIRFIYRNHPALLLVAHDVTEQQKVKEALREKERQYLGLLDEMSDGYIITRNGHIKFANRRIAEMLFYSKDEMIGKPWQDLLDPETADYISRSPMVDLPPVLDIQAVRSDGSKLPIELAVHPATYEGELAEFSIIRDITERKQIEALTRTQRDLGAALSATSDLREALNSCIEAAITASGMDDGGIYLVDKDSSALELACHKGLTADIIDIAARFEAHSPQARLILAGKPHYTNEQTLTLWTDLSGINGDIRAAAIIPFHHKSQVIGCLKLTSHTVDEISTTARNALETIATQIGSAIARLKAEEALRESEELKFRSLVEHSIDGVVLVDEQGAILEWNRGQEQLTGLRRVEVIGRPSWEVQFELLPEQQRTAARLEQTRANIHQLLETGQIPWSNPMFDQEIERADGERRIMQQVTFPIKTDEGFMAGGISRDITARIRAEEDLRKSEERYRFMIEKQGEGISIVDEEERFVFCNQVGAEIFGVPLNTLRGMSLQEFIAPEEFKRVQAHTERRRSGARDTYEVEITRPDGEKRQLLVTATPRLDKEGQFAGSFAIFRDDTERRQAQARLRLLFSAVEQSSEGIAVSDLEGRLLFVNHAFAHQHGYKAEELMGEHLSIFHSPEQLPAVKAAKQRVLERGEFSGELWHVRRDGSPFLGLMHNSLLRDETSTAIGMIGTLRDITQRKETEEALRRRSLELDLLNRASRALTATLDTDQVLTTVLNEMRYLLGTETCSAWLVDPNTDELVCWQAVGPIRELMLGWRLPEGEGLAGWVVDTGQSLLVSDAQADLRFYRKVAQQAGLTVRSVLSVPLRVGDRTIGVLQTGDAEADFFQSSDLKVLESLAATAATALENARLFEQARKDAATRAVLLREANHRVKNNLSAIIGMLYTASRYVEAKDQTTYQSITKDLINRVQGLAAVHSLLSASEWEPLLLSDLTAEVIRSALKAAPREKKLSVKPFSSPVRVTAEQANNLALIINELATNTVKYALQDRDSACITVRITHDDHTVQLEFRDDGPGYPEPVLRLEHHSVGFDLIRNIVQRNLRGRLALRNDAGAVTTIWFNAQETNREASG